MLVERSHICSVFSVMALTQDPTLLEVELGGNKVCCGDGDEARLVGCSLSVHLVLVGGVLTSHTLGMVAYSYNPSTQQVGARYSKSSSVMV